MAVAFFVESVEKFFDLGGLRFLKSEQMSNDDWIRSLLGSGIKRMHLRTSQSDEHISQIPSNSTQGCRAFQWHRDRLPREA